jgi:hypothetical protein
MRTLVGSDGEHVDEVLVKDVREDDQEMHDEGGADGVELGDGGCMSGADERDGDQDDHDEMLAKDVREDEVHEGGGADGVEGDVGCMPDEEVLMSVTGK